MFLMTFYEKCVKLSMQFISNRTASHINLCFESLYELE